MYWQLTLLPTLSTVMTKRCTYYLNSRITEMASFRVGV